MVFGTQKLQDQVFCLTQERDYFQSKFLEQVSEIQDLKSQLERSKKEISRLRQSLLNQSTSSDTPLCFDFSSPSNSIRGSIRDRSSRSSRSKKNRRKRSSLSTAKEDEQSKEDGLNHVDTLLGIRTAETPSSQQGDRPKQTKEDDEDEEYRQREVDDDNESESDSSEDEESEEENMEQSIRDNAAKLLVWADYSTSARLSLATPSKDDRDLKHNSDEEESTQQSSVDSSLNRSLQYDPIE